MTRYQATLGRVIGRPLPALIVYGVLVAALALLFVRLPTAFLPIEDQGSMIGLYTLPVGATQSRTIAVGKQIEHYLLTRGAEEHRGAVHGRRLQFRRQRAEPRPGLHPPQRLEGPAGA